MEKFKDTTGEEWILPTITLADAMAIEDYDFQGRYPKIKLVPPQEDLLTQQIRNTGIVFGIVWVLTRDQALAGKHKNPRWNQKDSNSPEFVEIKNELDFALRFDGATIAEMKIALWKELPNFFPEAATSLAALTEGYSRIQTIGNRRLAEIVNVKLSDEAINRMIDEAVSEAEALTPELLTITADPMPQPTGT